MKTPINLIISHLCLISLFLKEAFADGNEEIDSSVFQDIRPPVDFPFNSAPLIIALIVFLLLALAWAIWIFIRKNKHAKKIIEPPKRPDEIAYERLAKLIRKSLPEQGQVKEYFIEISDILRRYVEGRFKVKAPELTTPEFLEKIKKADQLNSDHKLLLKKFLICCDLVKFAKYGPSEKEIKESEALARRFVDETKQTVNLEKEAKNAV